MRRTTIWRCLLLAIFSAAAFASARADCRPGGRLSLDAGYSVMWEDVSSSTLYYPPTGRDGHQVPIFNGSQIECFTFTSGPTDQAGTWTFDLSAFAAGTLVDIYAAYDGGAPKMVGVSWTSNSPSLADAVYDGVTVNGAASPACPLYQCTFLGVVRIGIIPGVASFTESAGLDRENDVWNFYHQEPFILKITYPVDSNAAVLIGSDGTDDGSNLRSAMGCLNRDCDFSATTLIGRIGGRIFAEMFYDVRGLHGNVWQATANVAHVSAIGLDGAANENPPQCDVQATTNFEYGAPTLYFNTGLTKVATCAPDPSAIVGVHTFYLMEQQLDGYGQAWIDDLNVMAYVRGRY